jgi:hypothetical protein
MSTNSSQPTRKGVNESIKKVKSHIGLMSVHAMRKAMTTNISQAHRKATGQITQESNTRTQFQKSCMPNHSQTVDLGFEAKPLTNHRP